jgi:hypothetical protein
MKLTDWLALVPMVQNGWTLGALIAVLLYTYFRHQGQRAPWDSARAAGSAPRVNRWQRGLRAPRRRSKTRGAKLPNAVSKHADESG